MRAVVLIAVCLALAGCARAQVSSTRSQNNEAEILLQGLRGCSGSEVRAIAEKYGAIKTLEAGYDRFELTDGGMRNEMMVVSGMQTAYLGKVYKAKFFKASDPQAANALDAAKIAGENWGEKGSKKDYHCGD